MNKSFLSVKRLKISSRKCCDEYSATSVLPVQKRPQACNGSEISTEKLREMRIHHSRKKKYNPSDYEMLLGNYLDKYESLTLKEYTQATKLNGRNILLMRHDVDHDFETAIAMATWEHDRGIKATYCFLHISRYQHYE